MAQPPAYDRQFSFTNYQASNPSTPLPGASVDVELNTVKTTIDATLANLALIQRDDGALANGSVGLDQLSTSLSVGINTWTVWVTGHAYAVADTVFQGAAVYRCAIAHTSGTFATDLTAVKWTLVLNFASLTLGAAASIANTPAGNIAATNVQAAINELDSEKAATSHTHAASSITDSTADGRAFLNATLAAQKTLLGLGSLAYLNTIPVTDINAQLSFSGVIEPAALAASANDWAPTGVATCSTIRASASNSGVQITGLLAAAVDGTIVVIENVGTTYELTIMPSSASSAAANRFLMPKPIVISPNSCAIFKYDLDASVVPRWRPIANTSRLPRGWIDGLVMSNAADTTNDITIAVGECRGSKGILDIVLTTAITKQLDADWTAGTNLGGRYVSSANNPVITNTTYHLHLIGKADGTVDAIYYTGADPSGILPTGYIDYRRVGSITRTAAAIDQFTQRGDYVERVTPIADKNSTTGTTSRVTLAVSVPLGIVVQAEVTGCMAGAGDTWEICSLTRSDLGPANTSAPGAVGGVGNVVGHVKVWTNTSGQVALRTNDAGTAVLIVLRGYMDLRGADS